jgi:hypothetical protein
MSSEAKLLTLDIAAIRLDGGTQIRAEIVREVVEEYAEQIDGGAVFPRATVFDDSEHYWLADGFHRLHARLLLKKPTIDCLVYQGSLRDAILFAVKANSTHGLRRTNKDKRRAVEMILADEEWAKKANIWIAETCGVSRCLVEDVRRQHVDSTNSPKEGESRLGRDGKLRPARRSASPQEPDDPVAQALKCQQAFDACLTLVRRVAREAERLATGLGGRFLNGIRLAELRTHLSQAAETFAATRPSHRCGGCNGAGCAQCEQAGWLCSEQHSLDASM